MVIQGAAKDKTRTWALLVRHSPGTALPDRTFIVSEQAVQALRKAGIKFRELSRELKKDLKTSLKEEETLILERLAEVL